MLKEFKEFAMRGNVMDMAIGIIIGAAFGKIVSSFVGDIVMPFVGKATGGIDFSDLALNIGSEAVPVMVNYGVFVTTIIDFVIIAFVIFMVIKGMNAAKKKEEAAPAKPTEPPAQEVLLTEIRDLLKK
ncbi:MAG: large-conductance mechanosensitive channel protein MscL [Robiginitomaculum sp.]|nr:large-conductance mechanosensitive channel protein MscL [Robiginitomaculum sp.]